MNVIGESFVITIVLWVVGAIALLIAASFFLRPRTRRLYPGGDRRYLTALTVQATGFILPIPIVLLLLIGRPMPPYSELFVAVCAGLLVIYLLRALPITGPLLKDLHRARIAAVFERLTPPEHKP